MIPSKPTTTCSRKRTGIGTCSWTRHGRSSRERSAVSPARRSPPAGAAPPAALPARKGLQARTSGGGGCAAAARWGVGLQARAKGGEPLSQSPRTPSPTAGRWGRWRAGRLGVRDSGHPASAARSPRGQGVGGGAWKARLSRWRGGCLLRIDFPFPSPPPGRLSLRRAVAARFLGRPGLGTCGGRAVRDPAPSNPNPQAGGKADAAGIGSTFGSACRWTCWSGAGAGSPAGPVGAGSGRQTVLLLNSGGRRWVCVCVLPLQHPLIPGRRIWAT